MKKGRFRLAKTGGLSHFADNKFEYVAVVGDRNTTILFHIDEFYF